LCGVAPRSEIPLNCSLAPSRAFQDSRATVGPKCVCSPCKTRVGRWSCWPPMSGKCQFETRAMASRCIAFTVLRLMTSSFLEACSTDRSAGLLPTNRSPDDFVQSRCFDHHPSGVVSISRRGIVRSLCASGAKPVFSMSFAPGASINDERTSPARAVRRSPAGAWRRIQSALPHISELCRPGSSKFACRALM
jgi:hypothetical protein